MAGPGRYPVHEVGAAQEAQVATLGLALQGVGHMAVVWVQAEVASLIGAVLLDEPVAGVDVGPRAGRDVSVDRGAVHQTVIAEVLADLG